MVLFFSEQNESKCKGHSKSLLAKHNLDKFQHYEVFEIPSLYDDHVIFKFLMFKSDTCNSFKGCP